jgi:methionyl-tRNA synthetase
MLNGYKKSVTTPFIKKIMLDLKKMKAELNEHRYYLERNVERRTDQLLKSIALLESCNATLCDKLALTRKELSAIKQQSEHTLPKIDSEPNDPTVKLYVINNQTQKLIRSNVQDKWDEHVTAA